jgi:orotidine-5'-phosphate decarboxylase
MLIDKLITKISTLSAPIVVGLDPRLSQIPKHLQKSVFAASGYTPQATAEIFYAFNKAIIDAVCDLVPAVKPQMSFYEQLGAAGMVAYINTVQYAKSKGLIVIGDVKRSDIATTAQAYSEGHLGRVEIGGTLHTVFDTDFITVNPYMGQDSVEPFFGDCKTFDKGLFVLVKTSNPGSRDIQDVPLANGKKLYEHVGELVSNWGKDFGIGKNGFSAIGAVVGATHPEQGELLRKKMPHTFFLVPGYGAQGGSGKDLKGMFNANKLGVLVNSSRGITAAFQQEPYKTKYGEENFADAARAAVQEMCRDINENI